MDFHKIWEEQCEATRTIRERFGVENALDYLIGEKLLNFAKAADQDPDFAVELPRFQAAVWEIFNPYELRGYVASLKPVARKKLQKLLYELLPDKWLVAQTKVSRAHEATLQTSARRAFWLSSGFIRAHQHPPKQPPRCDSIADRAFR